MKSLYGGKFEELSTSEWIKRAKDLGMDVPITSYLEARIQQGGTVAFPFLGEP